MSLNSSPLVPVAPQAPVLTPHQIFNTKWVEAPTLQGQLVAGIDPPATFKVFTPPPRIDLAEFFDEPEPMDFVLPGLLAGTVGAIVSPGGAGKSMYVVQAATGIAGAEDLLELNLIRGGVVYLPAEDPKIALHHRFFALSKHWNEEQRENVRQNFVLHSLIGQEPDLFSETWFQWIDSLLDGKRILFLDTLRRFHKLDENDSGEMAEVIGRMELLSWKRRCAIVFLHHVGKSAAMGGQGDQQQASRGSGVLVDNIRWQMYLLGFTKEDARKLNIDEARRGFFVKAGVNKPNYGAPMPETILMRTDGGVLMPAEMSISLVTAMKGGRRAKA